MNMEERGKAARQKAQLGEITRARQCLTGTALAPGNDETFNELQGKRPQEVQRELPEHFFNFVPESPLVLDRDAFLKSLKTSPRGSSPGPGECTDEHLKVLLDETDFFELLFDAVTSFAQARIPASISKALTSARLTALTKKDGGIRGIATGVLSAVSPRGRWQSNSRRTSRKSARHSSTLSRPGPAPTQSGICSEPPQLPILGLQS